MINKEQMKEVLNRLSIKKEEKPYLSEAQFQFELAWELQKKKEYYKIKKILLEYTSCSKEINGKIKRFESDIIVQFKNNTYIAIELKYKTSKANVNGVPLTQQAGQPGTKYDYLWDIHRIELLQQEKRTSYITGTCIGGYAIFLTNDGSYWKTPKDTDTAYNFRLNNRIITPEDKLTWTVSNGEPKDWMKPRTPFSLLNSYDLKWEEKYSTYKIKNKSGKEKEKEFRYLLTVIGDDCNK